MLARFVAIAATLILVLATGAAHVSYLCLMDGQVRSTCCCKQAQSEQAGSDCPTVERQGCCEVRVSTAAQSPAMTKDGLEHERLPVPPAFAMVLPTIDVPCPDTRDPVLGSSARAPPSRTGPPLFVRNCRFLI